MNILGISAFYHDSAAALLVDGKIVAAAQEERFTRIKHDPSFPDLSVDYVLTEGNIRMSEVDFVAFYDKPLLKFERLLETYVASAPKGFRSFTRNVRMFLGSAAKPGNPNPTRSPKRPNPNPHTKIGNS